MEPLSLPVFGTSFICYYVALYYLWIYLRRKKDKLHIAFSFQSFSAALYNTFSFMLYNSRTLSESIVWQKSQFMSICLFGIGFVWFFYYFTGGDRPKRPYRFLTASFVVFLLIQAGIHNEWTLSIRNPNVRDIVLGGWASITYREVMPGILSNVQVVYEFLVFLFMFVLLIKRLRGKSARTMIFAFAVFLVSLANDIFVANDVYRFVYTAEYAFMFIVLSNANLLIDRFIDLQNEMEDVNRKLELRIAERTKELATANEALKELSLSDTLTGLRNRRYIQEYVFEYVNKFLKSKTMSARDRKDKRNHSVNDTVIGVMMLDIDHFKRVNDQFGHAAGDRVLRHFAERMKNSFRSDDIVIRWGGEEFLVILNKTLREYMPALDRKMLDLFRDEVIQFDEKTEGAVTCSIGSAVFPTVDSRPDLVSFTECIEYCDAALYLAKQAGRNKAIHVGIDEALLAERGPEYRSPKSCQDDRCLDDPILIKTVIE